MNTSFLSIVKRIITEQGEGILADPQRLKAFFSDLAKDVPKPLRIAFGRCVEAGAYNALKTALDTANRAECKAVIAQRLRDEYGLDITLCGEALDILEAALLADMKVAPRCASCGKELQEEWKACPFCGIAIGTKRVEVPTALPIPHITPKSLATKEQIPNDISNRKRMTSGGIARGIAGIAGIVAAVSAVAAVFFSNISVVIDSFGVNVCVAAGSGFGLIGGIIGNIFSGIVGVVIVVYVSIFIVVCIVFGAFAYADTGVVVYVDIVVSLVVGLAIGLAVGNFLKIRRRNP
jgi:hypothetical protein